MRIREWVLVLRRRDLQRRLKVKKAEIRYIQSLLDLEAEFAAQSPNVRSLRSYVGEQVALASTLLKETW